MVPVLFALAIPFDLGGNERGSFDRIGRTLVRVVQAEGRHGIQGVSPASELDGSRRNVGQTLKQIKGVVHTLK